jgi:hypothetical protein
MFTLNMLDIAILRMALKSWIAKNAPGTTSSGAPAWTAAEEADYRAATALYKRTQEYLSAEREAARNV